MSTLIRDLVKQATSVGDYEDLTRYIEYLYQFEQFRNMLNLALSLIKQNRLSFGVYQEGPVDMEEGTCETIKSPSGLNRYVVIVKRSNPYIVVHEISHMVEKELNLDLDMRKECKFYSIIYQDLSQNLNKANILVQNIVKQILIKEIGAYRTTKLQASEVFARYFEVFAWAQEVYPKDKKYLIRTHDLNTLFFATNRWKKNFLDPQIMDKLDKEIKEYSSKTPLKKVEEVRSGWADKFSPRRKKADSIFGDDK
ncbi:WD_0702 family putative metalloprotease [Wolbachia endosymbiont of Ctenocephalides felis wCfeT]|uniref:WD_0702 family putative metalloprotease n=1 Tax=Wolbachia endosymbiont of Ctenocephalides felis wCfeT TaxID=2732593 RepID=UPI001447896E|nr:hypothetical protein [Wolbachia endosymbiont of Ctenocephalides felis wCfeT]